MNELVEWLERNHITYRMIKDVVYVEGWGKALYQDMSDIKHIFKRGTDGAVVLNCIENEDCVLNDNIN